MQTMALQASCLDELAFAVDIELGQFLLTFRHGLLSASQLQWLNVHIRDPLLQNLRFAGRAVINRQQFELAHV